MATIRLFLVDLIFSTFLFCLLSSSGAEIHETFLCKRREEDGLNNRNTEVQHLEDRIEQLEVQINNLLAVSPDIRNMQRLERKLDELEGRLALLNAVETDVIRLTYNTIPKDCAQIYDNGEHTDGVYQISPDGRCPFDVYCDMTNGGWTIIQRRRSASVDFRRTWDEYAFGFGGLSKDFWLGLEKIHRLTQGGSSIQFQLGRYGTTNRTDWAIYNSFIVRDVMSGYAMNVDAFGYNGSIPELFSYHDGAKFSTFDRNQDLYSSNCSDKIGGGGGWWYTSCYRLGVFNGIYSEKVTGGNSYWDTKMRFITTTEIKIKPVHDVC